jgi:hypothetical protein
MSGRFFDGLIFAEGRVSNATMGRGGGGAGGVTLLKPVTTRDAEGHTASYLSPNF